MKWIELTKKSKNLPILIVDALANGFIKYFTDFHDGKTKILNYRQALNTRFISKSDFYKYLKMYKINEFKAEEWSHEWVKKFDSFKKYIEEINKLDLGSKTNFKLKKIFEKYSEHYIKVCSYAFDYHFVDSVYSEKIIEILKNKGLSAVQINNIIQIISTLIKPVFIHKEEFNILDLAIKIKRGDLKRRKLINELRKHRETYGFLGMYLHEGEATSLKIYEDSVNKLLKKSLDSLKKELIEKRSKFKNNNRIVNLQKRKIKLSDYEFRIIKLFRYVLFSSIYCDELYTYCAYQAKSFELSHLFSYHRLIG